jgi:hypothetical protein
LLVEGLIGAFAAYFLTPDPLFGRTLMVLYTVIIMSVTYLLATIFRKLSGGSSSPSGKSYTFWAFFIFALFIFAGIFLAFSLLIYG